MLEAYLSPFVLPSILICSYFRIMLDLGMAVSFLSIQGCLLLTAISFDLLFSENESRKDLGMELWGLPSKVFDRSETSESSYSWSTVLLLPWLIFVKKISIRDNADEVDYLKGQSCIFNSLILVILTTSKSFMGSNQKTVVAVGGLFSLLSGILLIQEENGIYLLGSGVYYLFSLYLLMITFPKSFTLVEASILSQFNSLAFITWMMPGYSVEKMIDMKIAPILLSLIAISFTISTFFMAIVSKTSRFLGPFNICVIFFATNAYIMYMMGDVFFKGNFRFILLSLDQVILETRHSLPLLKYWSVILLASLPLIFAFSSHSRSSSFTHNLFRKIFHFIIVLIVAPGYLLNRKFTSISLVAVFLGFLVIETLRHNNFPMLGSFIDKYLKRFTNDFDKGSLIVSHIYLLLAISIPIWLDSEYVILALSGCSSIGILDAVASIVGHKYGVHKWPDSKKSLEGSFAGALAMTAFNVAINWHITNFSPLTPEIVINHFTVSVFVALWEALSTQNDNLTLPLISYILQ